MDGEFEWEACKPPEGADELSVKWRREESGRWAVTTVILSASCVTGTMLRSVSPATLEARRNAVPHADVPRRTLSRPGTDPAFYSHVATAYRQYAETGAPAKTIADEAGVPVTTAHRWVREARQRGFLPPARRGKVG